MLKLSFIFVNYNVKRFLNDAIISVKNATANIESEIIVVDNASIDGSDKFFPEEHPDIKYIYNEKNVGFGKANNQAFELADGEYLVIINPDTVVNEDTFEKMLEFFNEHPDAGMAGCKVLNPDGTLQLACRRSFPGPWVSFTRVTGLSHLFPKSKIFAKYNLTYRDENQSYEVDAISGSFMMLRKSVYDKIGGFDPVFFMYGEDLDLCFRTQEAGYKVYYVHTTEITHFKGESTKRSSLDEAKVFYDAMHLFVKKHLSSSFLVEFILRIAIFFRHTLAYLGARKLIITAVIFDFILLAGAAVFAETIYHPGNWSGFPDFTKPWVYIYPASIQVFIASLTGSYRKNSISNLRMMIALIIGFVFLASFIYFFKQFAFSRAILLIIYSVSFITFTSWRIIFKLLFREKFADLARRNNNIIIGTSPNALLLADKLKKNDSQQSSLVGLISNSTLEIGSIKEGVDVIGSIDTLYKVITEYKINRVIFVPNETPVDTMYGIVSEFNRLDVDFVIAGSDQDFMVGKSSITMLDKIPLFKLSYNITSPTYKISKRILDISLSFFLLLFIYPFVYLKTLFVKKKSALSKLILSIPSIFAGKKSFVGPISNENSNLFLGKPGITGLWFTEMIDEKDEIEINKLNIFYARNQSIWYDLEIIGKTISRIFIK